MNAVWVPIAQDILVVQCRAALHVLHVVDVSGGDMVHGNHGGRPVEPAIKRARARGLGTRLLYNRHLPL